MAAYIPVPRDLTRVKSKILFNLTKRQLLSFGAGALIGVPSFFLIKAGGNTSMASICMILIMLPFFFLGMYERDGQPLEKIAMWVMAAVLFGIAVIAFLAVMLAELVSMGLEALVGMLSEFIFSW